MDWKLEVVVVPVTDVDRAKSFLRGQAGISPRRRHTAQREHAGGAHDAAGVGMLGGHRPVQVGADADLGTMGARLQLVVTDIEAARSELVGKGLEVTGVQILDPRDGGKFCYFADPDGNNWAVQEVRKHVGAELD